MSQPKDKSIPSDLMESWEVDLIPPENWKGLYLRMPKECQAVVDELEADPMSRGGPTGIGRNKTLGWFICGSGQGPYLEWSEKGQQ